MRRQSPLSAALALAAALAVSSCSAPSLRVSPRVAWDMDVEGDLVANTNDLVLNSDTDSLGIEGESVFMPRLDFEAGPFQWTVDYTGLSNSGTGTADVDVGGLGTVLDASVDTELDIDLYRSSFTWDVIPGDTIDLGIGFGLGAADFAGSVTELGANETGSADALIPLPYGAASATVELGPFGLEGLVGYFSLDLDDVEVTYLDIDANLYWQFVGVAGAGIRLVGGYRHIGLDAAFDDGAEQVNLDLEFSGPYAGLTFVF